MLATMVGHTVAADPLAGAGFVGTIAVNFIRRGFAFHLKNPHEDEKEPAKILTENKNRPDAKSASGLTLFPSHKE